MAVLIVYQLRYIFYMKQSRKKTTPIPSFCRQPLLLRLVCFLPLVILVWSEVFAESQSSHDNQVKAGFIYNFALFVDWPESAFPGPEAPLQINVLRDDLIGDSFQCLTNKIIRGRKVHLRASQVLQLNSSGNGCHICFLNSDERGVVRKALDKFQDKPVLTVADREEFAEMGVIITILKESRGFRLVINLDAAKRAGLKISSRLLKLKRTRIIKKGGR
jgi:uncharacterized protein DUF4154